MRGMVAGEPIKTGAASKEYEDGHERTFGTPDPAFPRGRRFRWDPELKKLVPAGGMTEAQAQHAAVMVGRFYENQHALDPQKTDIGSRRKHREYMKANGLTIATDFTEQWKKDSLEKERIRKGEHDRKERREQVDRAWHKVFKP